jgi:hypothetical protein
VILPYQGWVILSLLKEKYQPYKGWVSLGSWVAICKKKLKELVLIHNRDSQNSTSQKTLT